MKLVKLCTIIAFFGAPTGGLGAVRRRLRRVVPPGVRGRVVRDGRERGLHLRGLLAQGRRRPFGRGGGGPRRGERHRAVHQHVRRRAGPTVSARRHHCHLAKGARRATSQPSGGGGGGVPSAAAAASAGQLALPGKKTQDCIRTLFLFITLSLLVSSFQTCEPVCGLQDRVDLYSSGEGGLDANVGTTRDEEHKKS